MTEGNSKILVNYGRGDTLVTPSAGGKNVSKRRPALYKRRGSWYARFWNSEEGKYHAKALGIPVEGKRERRREAEDLELRISMEMDEPKAIQQSSRRDQGQSLFLDFVEKFWQRDSQYAKYKALVEKKPLSKHHIGHRKYCFYLAIKTIRLAFV